MNVTLAQTTASVYKANDKEVVNSRKARQQSVAEEKYQMASTVRQQKDTVELTGRKEIKAIYGKPDHNAIKALKAESERVTNQLRQLVERLLNDQGRAYEAATRAEAQKLIADDGPLGAEAVSNRIVDFAIAVSGGDPAQYEKLKAAIEKGFSEAKQALGGELPDICQKTYDLVMEKLDRWAGKTTEEK